MTFEKGDFISIKRDCFVAFPGGAWGDHFAPKTIYLCFCENPPNNYNCIVKDKAGHRFILNLIAEKAVKVKEASDEI